MRDQARHMLLIRGESCKSLKGCMQEQSRAAPICTAQAAYVSPRQVDLSQAHRMPLVSREIHLKIVEVCLHRPIASLIDPRAALSITAAAGSAISCVQNVTVRHWRGGSPCVLPASASAQLPDLTSFTGFHFSECLP